MRAAPRQPSKQWSNDRCATSPSMPACATLRVGRPVAASLSQRSVSSMCSRLRERLAKYGCQPRPTGWARASVLVNARCSASDSAVSTSRWRKVKANGQSASAACWYCSSASVALDDSTCQARAQATPCIACGLPSVLAAMGWSWPCQRKRRWPSRLLYGASTKPPDGRGEVSAAASLLSSTGTSPRHRPVMQAPRSGRSASRSRPADSAITGAAAGGTSGALEGVMAPLLAGEGHG